jgi:hypothetical protein
MNNKPGWRKGFGFAQIMAMVIVVIPVTLFIITLLFDYWAAMQLDNRLKLMSHRAITAINSSGDLSTSEKVKTSLQASGEWARIQTLCPSSQPTLDIKTRVGDLNQGQTQIETFVTYNKFNHLGSKRLSSTIISYSYNDQNGSFQLECI